MTQKTKMTMTELMTEVGTFYKRALHPEKALQLFEMEYGYLPEIIEPNPLINQKFIDAQDYPECVTVEALTYMKELQESGVTNMFQAVPYIQQALMYDRHEARDLLMVYMKDYTKIYFPEMSL